MDHAFRTRTRKPIPTYISTYNQWPVPTVMDLHALQFHGFLDIRWNRWCSSRSVELDHCKDGTKSLAIFIRVRNTDKDANRNLLGKVSSVQLSTFAGEPGRILLMSRDSIASSQQNQIEPEFERDWAVKILLFYEFINVLVLLIKYRSFSPGPDCSFSFLATIGDVTSRSRAPSENISAACSNNKLL